MAKPKTQTVTLRMPRDMVTQLDKLETVSRSAYINAAVRYALSKGLRVVNGPRVETRR